MKFDSEMRYEADLCGNIEQALKALQGYGLMALELIQNADDAGATSLTFDIKPNALQITNNARFTSCGLENARCPWEKDGDPNGISRPCNFHAISRMGSRSKIEAPDQIGRFGIGFVSVYQVTDTPTIRSSGVELQLNPYTGRVKQRQIEDTEETVFFLPWASRPTDVRQAINASPTPQNVAELVIQEVSQVLRTSTIFLRHLTDIHVLESGVLRSGLTIERGDDQITLHFYPESDKQRWLVIADNADVVIGSELLHERFDQLTRLNRSTKVSIAVPVDGGLSEGHLYAYLPTQQGSGLPVHINADFFPHASRQEVVLRGEGHERYWNEALLETAADMIGTNFELLKSTLGPVGLWQLGSKAHALRNEGAFAVFWKAFSAAAKVCDSVFTELNEWQCPEQVFLGSEKTAASAKIALTKIGLPLLNSDIRPYWSCLSSLGVRKLDLKVVAPALGKLTEEDATEIVDELPQLWSVVGSLLEQEGDTTGLGIIPSGFTSIRDSIQKSCFLLDIDRTPVSPESVWRLPEGMSAVQLRRFVADCPIVHPDVLGIEGISKLLDLYKFQDFANNLVQAFPDVETANELLGPNGEGVRDFYALMLAFSPISNSDDIETILADVPFLRVADGYVSPARAQLPGGFEDPTGYLKFVDTSMFPPGTSEFIENELGVRVVRFSEYLDQHLEEILEAGPTREQYQRIIEQIVEQRYDPSLTESLTKLAKVAFVRTRGGSFARPCDCYYWSAERESVLGRDYGSWVDEDWLSRGQQAGALRQFLEDKVGMPTRISARHIVGRIEEISKWQNLVEAVASVDRIVRRIIRDFNQFPEDECDEFKRLSQVAFLPASLDQVPGLERLYAPCQIYRVTRSEGYISQVRVINLPPLRRSAPKINSFIDLLGVQIKPATDVIVAHLRHCMETETAPSDTTYALLNERVADQDDLDAIDTLKNEAFIYDPGLGRFLSTDHVFWHSAPIGEYWHLADDRMHRRTDFYRRLGVRDKPGPIHYANLMLELCEQLNLNSADIDIHALCLREICNAVDAREEEADEALVLLAEAPSLLSVDGEALWPKDAVWIDSRPLAEPFGSSLNHMLVHAPDTDRSSVSRLFERLDVQPLSEVVKLRLAVEPDRAAEEHATSRLQERTDLLLWLAPNDTARHELRDILTDLTISLTGELRILAEKIDSDPAVLSPSTTALAFLEREKSMLHASGCRLGQSEWTAAFRVLFAEIERFSQRTDVKPLAMTATLVMLSASWDEAERTLRNAEFQPPASEAVQVSAARSIASLPEEELLDAGSDKLSDFEVAPDDFAERPGAVPGEDVESASGTTTSQAPQAEHNTNAETGFPSETPASTGTKAHAPNQSVDSEPADDDYRSKAGTGAFGSNVAVSGQSGKDGVRPPAAIQNSKTSKRERSTRTERMLAYVARSGDRGLDDREAGLGSDNMVIDTAAIKAALRYETERGWSPEEQDHFNPGFDIISTGPNGKRRLIEVKGLRGPWTERGTKLSHVQFEMAQQYPEEFWIYIVEEATDRDAQRISAIANPFVKVKEYWFDSNWRGTAEEVATARDLNVRIGVHVQHEVWGKGEIIDVKKRGMLLQVTVDFGFQGKKSIPYNNALKIAD